MEAVPKRPKTSDLSNECSISLISWLIKDWNAYNSTAARSRKGSGSIKKQFWIIWSRQLGNLGEPRTPEQVKKRINGEISFVQKRISDECYGNGYIFPLLSPSRQLLYDHLINMKSEIPHEDHIELEDPLPKRTKISDDWSVDVESVSNDNGADENEDPNASGSPSKWTIASSPAPLVSNTAVTVHDDDIQQIKRQILLEELEAAKWRRMKAEKEYQNAAMESERLALALDNEKIKREMLIIECREKGVEVLSIP